MAAVVERLAVVGLGLLGGSLAMAARQRGVAARVAAATRRQDVLREALRRGLVDEVGTPAEVVSGADLVVLATPLFAMQDSLRELAPQLGEGSVVTDVGSVKGLPVDTLPGLLPRGACYVGSHPMAGSHLRGFEHARADLFDGAACVVTGGADARAVERVCAFWRGLGARVVVREPADHDAQVAWMSHLPHVLAFAFARALGSAPPGSGEVAGAGFSDFTRIAHSDPELWAEILSANRKALASPIQAVARSLDELARAIEANDTEDLERRIAEARTELSRGFPQGDPRTHADDTDPSASSAKTAEEGDATTTDE